MTRPADDRHDQPRPQVVPCSWQRGGPITLASDTQVDRRRESTRASWPQIGAGPVQHRQRLSSLGVASISFTMRCSSACGTRRLAAASPSRQTAGPARPGPAPCAAMPGHGVTAHRKPMSTRGVTASVVVGRPNADASSRRVPNPPPGPAWPVGHWSATGGSRPGRDARPPRQQELPRSSWWTRSRNGTSRTIGGRRRSVPQHTHRAQGVGRSRAAGSCRDRATTDGRPWPPGHQATPRGPRVQPAQVRGPCRE